MYIFILFNTKGEKSHRRPGLQSKEVKQVLPWALTPAQAGEASPWESMPKVRLEARTQFHDVFFLNGSAFVFQLKHQ